MGKYLDLHSMTIGEAVLENVADGMAEIIRHHQDARVGNGKPSELTVKVVVVPNYNRTAFAYELRRDAKLAKRESEPFTGKLFVKIDGDDLDITEHDPMQTRMDLDGVIERERRF